MSSEEWLERRTNFTRSLAVMSMVGYILGLGDRHPSNLMLDQISGRVLHIDFGDCFEVAMHREKFPEKVPFRLTRMLTRAMEVSGIEGSYGSTCERTMAVLRDNKDSLVAMLEAFVYDPLISWRMLDQSADEVAKESEVFPSNSLESQGKRSSVKLEANNVAVAHTTLPGPIQEEQDEDGEEEDDEDEEDDNDDNDEDDDNNDNGIDDGDDDRDDQDEDDEEPIEGGVDMDSSKSHNTIPIRQADASSLGALSSVTRLMTSATPHATSHAKSLQMYSEMRALAANLSISSRIASIAGDAAADAAIDRGSTARSRIDNSVRQRKLLSVLDGGKDSAVENKGQLNERALKVIQRVQDKLTGTDFHSSLEEVGKPLDVQDQVQRLIVQATSSENLSQLFIGWCAFW